MQKYILLAIQNVRTIQWLKFTSSIIISIIDWIICCYWVKLLSIAVFNAINIATANHTYVYIAFIFGFNVDDTSSSFACQSNNNWLLHIWEFNVYQMGMMSDTNHKLLIFNECRAIYLRLHAFFRLPLEFYELHNQLSVSPTKTAVITYCRWKFHFFSFRSPP